MSGSTTNGGNINSGSDTITLKMSEDQALGVDAKFTVNVDGQQIGGLQTVTASHAAGQDQTFSFQGDYGPGSHNVIVTFDNNFIYPGVAGDRNLYVDAVTYDGQTVSDSTTPIYETPFFPPNSTEGNVYGNAVFQVNDTTAIPNGVTPQTTTPGPVSVGSGSDTLVLNMAEDAYQGDAQFTVSVDGNQIGGTQTTTAFVDQGQQQEFDVHGNFGGGDHTVSVNFLNDQIGAFYPDGTPGLPPGQWADDTTDRNLYVMGMSLNGGAPASGTPWELSSSGSFSWNVGSGSNPSAGAGTSSGTSDTAAITSGSLNSNSTGSATGMSFVAPSDTSAVPATSAATDSSGLASSDTTGSGSTTSTDTTPSIAALDTGATQTVQDFSVPSTTNWSDSSTAGGSSGNWWTNPDAGNMASAYLQQNG
jgi:hypothetical protein